MPKVQAIENPAATGAQFPRLTSLPDGGVLMSWMEPLAEGHVLKFGVLRDGQWVHQGEVARGDNWFINGSDFPSVAAIDKSFWVAHWLVRQKGGRIYDYDIATSISNDAGATWSAPKPPHRDGSAAEHGFAVIFPTDGDAGIIWLDGRDYLAPKDRGKKHLQKSGNFALRYTRIHRDGRMDAEQVIDDNTCTCCWPAAAATPIGPVAAWRGRTDGEIRDHRVARLHNGKWSAPIPLGDEGWEISGCPVNGPALAARGMQVVAAWFTAEGDHPRVRAAFSTDGGQSFGQPIDVDKANPSGRIGIAWLDDRTAVVSWITADAVTKETSLVLRKLHTDGSSGPIRRIAGIGGSRDTGVPQLAADGSGFIMAWTGEVPGQGIRTVAVPPGALGR
ncbi:MAG: hypothetical protein L0H37_06905 [Nitrosospira sp.]|nr:hypothetical protein [Nitrosospira sp.]